MKNKLFATILIGIMSFTLVSCGDKKETVNNTKNFTIESKEFTDEQNEVLTLTGNRAFKFDLKNLPTDKSFELKLVYEVYKNKEKVKEQTMFAAAYDTTEDNREDTNIALNIQENKIRIMSCGAYGSIDIDEDITKLTNYYFNGTKNITLGDEIYLFHALSGNTAISMQSMELSKEDVEKVINENEMNVFIKLICK